MNTARFPIHFIGAGPGAEDLITERGAALLKEADVVVYAGSLVNPGHLKRCRPEADLHDSARMNLEEQVEVMSNSTCLTRRALNPLWCRESAAFLRRRRPCARN